MARADLKFIRCASPGWDNNSAVTNWVISPGSTDVMLADKGRFVAPEDGLYHVSGWIAFQLLGDPNVQVRFCSDDQAGTVRTFHRLDFSVSGFGGWRPTTTPFSFVACMDKEEWFEMRVAASSGNVQNGQLGNNNLVLHFGLIV